MMKLYKVEYRMWNSSGTSELYLNKLSIGNTEAEAIENVRTYNKGEGSAYSATEISEIMGHRIFVDEMKDSSSNKWIPCEEKKPERDKFRVWMSFPTPWGGYVRKGLWVFDHFEWENGRHLKDEPDAWMPLSVPKPY